MQMMYDNTETQDGEPKMESRPKLDIFCCNIDIMSIFTGILNQTFRSCIHVHIINKYTEKIFRINKFFFMFFINELSFNFFLCITYVKYF